MICKSLLTTLPRCFVWNRENEEQKAHSPEQIAEYRERLLERVRPVIEQHQEKSQAQDLGIAI
jgi:hypothetical protein